MRSRTLPWLWRIPLFALMIIESAALAGWLDLNPDYTTLGLLMTSTVTLLFIEVTARRVPPNSPVPLYWWAVLPGVLVVAFDAGGDIMHWYSSVEWYDVWMHFSGTFTVALYLWNLFAIHNRHHCPPSQLILLACTTAITFSVIYEIEEYLEDVFTSSNRLGDGPDTGNDLMMNFFGAFVAFLLVHAITKKYIRR